MPGPSSGSAARRRAATLDRRLALAAAVVLFASPWLPWYGWTATARSATGRALVAHASFTGWQAISGAQVVAALVALGVAALVLTRAPGRLGGVVTAAGGALSALLVLVKLVHHPGPSSTIAHTTVSVDWGLVVALLAGVAVCALGVRIALREPVRPRVRDRSGTRAVSGSAGVGSPASPASPSATGAPERTVRRRPRSLGETRPLQRRD